jgi:hypothetical protein
MLTRRNLIFGSAGLFGVVCRGGGARAHDESPRAFLSAIYATYEGEGENGIPLNAESDVRRYFAPALAARIIVERNKLIGRSGGGVFIDPFVDAADWNISAIVIDVTYVGSRQASATVTFRNRDDLTELLIDLVKIDNDWRIGSITRQYSIRRIRCDCEKGMTAPDDNSIRHDGNDSPSFTLGR